MLVLQSDLAAVVDCSGALAMARFVARQSAATTTLTTFAFLSQPGFLAAPAPQPGTPFAVAGIAWDGSTTNRPGARMAPRAIRQASQMLCDGTHPLFDVSPLGQLGNGAMPATCCCPTPRSSACARPCRDRWNR